MKGQAELGPVTQAQLERYLWGAATLLRGVIDAGDYKQFIFPLLFFKRISDVYDDEFRQAMDESKGDVDYASFAENHRFQVPKGAHWSDMRATSANVGQAIQKAMRDIEQVNPGRLYGIFGDAQWTNKDRLSDATLRDLIEHFSTLDLSVSRVPQDELGIAYEFLIKKFADDSGHTAAEFYTNRTLVRLMTRMLAPEPGESVYDPTCGTGGMLLVAAIELKEQGKEYRNLKLYGQERNLLTSAIARMNLFLHGIEDFQIERANSLEQPKFLEGDQLRQFDVVLANPPYSIKQWDRTGWTNDPYGRNKFGVPPQGRADYAFFQHILASMKTKSGRCAILFPHGVLFRDEEQAMRARIIDADLIEAVIGLGPNLFYNSPMEACIVVCRTRKHPTRRSKILFVNAIEEVTRHQAKSFLEDRHIARIVEAYRRFESVEGFASVAPLDEIRGNASSLNISLYVRQLTDGGAGQAEESLNEVVAEWLRRSAELRSSLANLFIRLGEAGFGDP
jgi:type I restriction enzyme M protein